MVTGRVDPGWRPLAGWRPQPGLTPAPQAFGHRRLWSLSKYISSIPHSSGLRPSPRGPVKVANCHFSSGFLRRKMKSVEKTDDSIRKDNFLYFPNLKSVFPEQFYFLRYNSKRKGHFWVKMTKKWPFFDKFTPLPMSQCSWNFSQSCSLFTSDLY